MSPARKAARRTPASGTGTGTGTGSTFADGSEFAEFAEVARSYRPRLYALALQLTGSAADAEDVAQESLLRAYQHLDGFEGRSALHTWLYRITVNRAFSHRQRRARSRSVTLDDDRVRAALAVDAADPQEACELAERYLRLLDALDRLSPLLRTTVVLVTLHGMRHEEAAEVLGCSPGTIGYRIHEARRKLRRWVDHPDETGDEDPISGVRPVRR